MLSVKLFYFLYIPILKRIIQKSDGDATFLRKIGLNLRLIDNR